MSARTLGRLVSLGVAVAASGCAGPAPVQAPAQAPSPSSAELDRAIALAESPELDWIRDDPRAAFARAKREHKLVFVDLWAAWCHTCLSMQEFVLTRPKLGAAEERFVFLAIDTELARNAWFLQRFPTSGWPTFYVLSADGQSVRGRWVGAASAGQLARFFMDSERTDDVERSGTSNGAYALLAAADELASRSLYAEAAEKYADALRAAPHGWPRAADVRVARASALSRSGNPGACVEMAFELSFEELSPPISAADHASYTLDCAERLPETDPRRRPARERVEARLTALCEHGADELTPDDRSDACGNLMAVREALGDTAGARRAAETRLELLELASTSVPDAIAVIYDPARTETLLALGRAEEALALLNAREAALPDSYTPPYYAARVALKLERFDAGLASIGRALALATGPRRANVLGVKVDLLLAAGRKPEALQALNEQLATLAALPEGQKRVEAERTARERKDELTR